MAPGYRIRIHGIFESAHYLYDYHGPGKNEALHGHTFEAELFVESEGLNNGISVDFLTVRERFDRLMEEMDHKCLNTIPPFIEKNPTSENIAHHIFDTVRGELPPGASIAEVRVWEGPKHYASYLPG